MTAVLVEPMINGGIETIVGVVQEPVFGPVVVFGLGGIATGMLADHTARLAPLTDADADDLIRSIRAARALLEHEVDIAALRHVLLRASRLADDLPQVVELDLNPVIVRPDGAVAVDARIRVTSHHLADPFLRQAIEDCRRELPGKPGQALAARLEAGGAEPDEALAARLSMRVNTFLQNFTRARRLLADCLRRHGIDLDAELAQ